MTLAMEPGVRRVATYERVSSEDQRERETIKTQRDALDRRFASEPAVIRVDRYVDEAVSGSKGVADRPDGGRLLRDAEVGRFNELWVYRLDRLGRDLVDMAIVGRRLRQLRIRLVSLVEGEPDPFMFDIQAALAENEKRIFRQRSADGMERAAREGRYTGGIVAFGYVALHRKEMARLVPDTRPLSDTLDLSAADVIRRMYHRLAIDGWTCPRIAIELNALAVPTSYARVGREVKRGERRERTQGVWRGGRIRNMVREPKYMGRLEYGRRTKQPRDVIPASIVPLVSEELWQAAQQALYRNRRVSRNTRRRYLLKGVIRCGCCGLTYIGSQGRPGASWYRCGGRQRDRGPLGGACPSAFLRGDEIERQVWTDIERFLRNPGDVLADLKAEIGGENDAAIAEADLVTLRSALDSLHTQRERVLGLAIRGHIVEAEADLELDRIARERAALDGRVAELEAPHALPVPDGALDLLDEVRSRLEAGLTDEQRQEIVRLLVKITVRTDAAENGIKKSARAVIEYAFPKTTLGVLQTSTGTGSLPPPAGTAPGRWWPARRGRSRPAPLPSADEAPPARHVRIRGAHRETARPDQPW